MTVMQSTLIHMAIYVALVAAGILLGGRQLWGARTSFWLGKLQLVSLLALIVALGIRLGADEQVMSSLGQIGLASLTVTLFSMAGSLIAVTLLRRFVLRLDRFARDGGTAAEEASGSGTEEKADNSLTKWIVLAVAAGMGVGYFVFSGRSTAWCGRVIDVGLYLLLFLVGFDMGQQGNVLRDIRNAGFRVLLVPFTAAAGTLVFAFAAGFLLPLRLKETVAVSAGFGWYSLAPTLLEPYSLTVSAIAFLSNVLREIFSIVAIPFIARSVGYLECVALPGAAAMDTVLPVIVGATHERVTVYAFISGLILSFLVPVLVPIIISL